MGALKIVSALVVIDQGAKYLVLAYITPELPLINIYYHEKSVLWALIAAIVTIIFAVLSRTHTPFRATNLVGISLILAGGISNIIDYARLQAVIDIFAIRTSHFNLADLYILFGALLIIWSAIRPSSVGLPQARSSSE